MGSAKNLPATRGKSETCRATRRRSMAQCPGVAEGTERCRIPENGRNGISDPRTELFLRRRLCSDGELEPVGKALYPGSFSRGEGPGAKRMNETTAPGRQETGGERW